MLVKSFPIKGKTTKFWPKAPYAQGNRSREFLNTEKLHKIDVQGDSGGPLTVDGVLVGIVSRGGSQGCVKVTHYFNILSLSLLYRSMC